MAEKEDLKSLQCEFESHRPYQYFNMRLNMEKSKLQEVLEDILDDAVYEFTIRSYSGRGMYGKECLAIVTNEDIFNIGVEVGVAYKSYGYYWEEIPEIKKDNMGTSLVYYWPDIDYVEDTKDEPST